MKKFYFALSAFSFLLTASVPAQNWVQMMQDPNVNFYTVQSAFNQWWNANKPDEDVKQDNLTLKGTTSPATEEKEESMGNYILYKRWEWKMLNGGIYSDGSRVQAGKTWQEFQNWQLLYGGGNGPEAGSWTFLGPSIEPTNGGVGRVNCVRFDPANGNNVFVGSPGGGLWKSTNGGTSWTMWNTDGLGTLGVTDIAIDPTNSNIMYLGTGDGDAQDTYAVGVLKSTDGGVTWNTTGLNWAITNFNYVHRILIDPSNTQIIHVACGSGIYRSTDGGTTFAQILSGNVYNIEFQPGSPAIICAAAANGVFRSTNSGSSYSQTLTVAGMIRTNIAVTAANNQYVYCLAANNANYGFGAFYRSTNGGASFTQITVSSPSNLLGWASAGNDTGGQGWYDLALAASPTNANEVVCGGVNIWRTTNGGTNWTLNGHWTGTGAPYVHADHHCLIYVNGTTYWDGCDGGTFNTTNSGGVWTDKSNNLQIAEMYRIGQSASTGTLLLNGLQDNGTTRYNGSWAEVLGGDGMECFIDRTNNNTMYGEQYNGSFNRSTNGGGTWSAITTGLSGTTAWVTPWVQDPQTANTLWCGRTNVFKSANQGTNWAQAGTIAGAGVINWVAVAPSNNQIAFAAKASTLWKTTDGGTTWSNVTGTIPASGGTPLTYVAIDNTNPNNVWVTLGGYTGTSKVFKSTDGGTTWTNMSTGLPNIPANTIVFQNGTNGGIYVGMDIGVYYRDNTLGSWVSYFTGLPNVKVDELEIQYTVGKIRAATYGRGVWESGLYSAGNSAPVADFTANRTSGCPGVQIQFTDLSAFSPTSWSWTFPGGTPASSTAQNPLVTYNTVGVYNVTLTATNINGSNTATKTNYITISGTQTTPLVEGFQNLPFLPNNWLMKDDWNDGIVWTRNTAVGGFSASGSCAQFDNYNPNVTGSRDEMWTPKIDFSSLGTAQMTFDVAYARYNATYSDSLAVYVSTDCGATFTQVYLKGGTTLATAPDLTTAAFVPTTAQWRTETVNLNAYAGQPRVMVVFQNRSRWGQMLYVDNINITGTANLPPTAAFTASSNSFCAGSCINFTDNSTGNPTAWSWTFTGGSPSSSTVQNPTNICYNTAGTYTVTLVASNSFGSNTATQSITVNAIPVVTKNPAAPSICSGGSVSITASGASTYAWAPATGLSATTGATVTASPTTTTTYTITGTSGAGCSATTAVTVTVNPNPTVTANPSAPSYCAGGSVSITAGGASTYAWAPATGLSSTTGATVTASPTTTTTYTITGTSGAGCTNTVAVTVTVNPIPTITKNPAAPSICSGGSVAITAGGASTYAWAPATGLSATTGATVTASPTTTTTYTITGTSGAGCTNTTTVTVTVNPLPVLTANPSAPSYCAGGSVSITAGGASTYAWAPATGLSATTGATVTASPTATTTYTITGTSGAGCTNTLAVTVTVNPLPNVTANPSAPSYCAGGSVSITAGGASTYAWAPATGLSSTTGATVTASPTTTTTYTITGTSGAGCTKTLAVTVTVNPIPVITKNPAAPSICSGGSVAITAGGASTYAWAPATGLSATTGATVTASPTTTTTYTITGTSGAGCTASTAVTVTVNPSPVLTVNPSAPSYCAGGSVSITAGGASTYAWAPATGLSSTTGATVTASPTTTTTYTITGTSGAGCTKTLAVTVTVNPLPTITKNPASPSVCTGGSVTITAGGASTYAWAPATGLNTTTGATVIANPTSTTTYTITGTSGAGCTNTTAVTVTVNPTPTVTCTPSSASICPGGNVSLTASGASTYSWAPATGLSSTTGATVTASPTTTTTYTITGTSGAGCSKTIAVTITVFPAPNPTITQAGNVLSCSPSFVSYQWYLNGNPISGATNQTYSMIVSGTYMVCVTDANGCTACSANFNGIFTGTNELFAGGSITIFPNPNSGQFEFTFTTSITDNYTVELINYLGQIIYKDDLRSYSGTYVKHFDLTKEGSGMYMMTVKNSKNQSVRKVIVY